MTHEILYRKIGVHKLNHMLTPRILLDEDFIFPQRSELDWFKVSAVVDTPSSKAGYLKNVKDKPLVISRYLYSNPTGNFRSKESVVPKVIREQQKAEPKLMFVKVNQRNLKVSKDRLIINNYGMMSGVHEYRPNPTMVYDRWSNAFKTLIDNLNNHNDESRRHHYLMLEIPANLPTKEKFDRALKEKPLRVLKDFPTPKHLNILELWKFLSPDYIKESLLYGLKRSFLENVTIIFTFNNKLTLINLNTLVSAVKEYEGKTNIQEQSSNVIKKMLLIYLMKLKNDGAKSFAELENETSDLEITGFDKVDDSNMKDVNVDVLLEEEEEDELDTPNYDELSDDMLNTNSANVLVDEVEENYESIKELNKGMDPRDKISKQVEILKEAGTISKKEMENFKSILEDQDKMSNPYGDSKETLKEMLTVKPEDLIIPEEIEDIPDINIIPNKNALKDPIKAMDRHYIKNVYKKDILSSIYAIHNNDMVIKDHQIDQSEDVLGGIEIHTLEIKPLSGKPSKITFRIPKMEEDGTFKLSGNKYTLRKQRADVPIRKIASDKVALSSYYGKSFITRSDFKKDQIGYWFRKKLIEVSENNSKISNLVFMPVKLMDVKTPTLYSNIANYVKMFKVGNVKFNFDYHYRMDLLTSIDIKEIEGNKYVLVGHIANKIPMLMGFDNKLYKYENKKYVELPSIFEHLGIDTSTMPVESIGIKVFKKRLPVVMLLSYYLGFKKLLKLLKAKHKILDRGNRYTLESNEYSIVFKDYKVILDRNDKVNSLILAGFNTIAKEIKSIEMNLLDKKESFPVLFNALDLPTLYINEIRLLEDMFVDPITKSVLSTLKEPETFKGLLIRAAELLQDNDYVNPNDSSGILIKGHERIAGMIYTEMVSSVRDYENKNTFSKAKLTMDPFAIWRKINNDSTVMLADDLNPIASLKQSEDVTYMGEGGISKDAISQDKRIYHPSEVGVISEAVKDSGDVGVSAYMSANPKIANIRGKVADNKGKLDPSSCYSTSTMLSPNADKDDGKRANFIQIQNGHVIPINEMRVPAVRTGYEAILPYRMGETYCYMAEEDGVVESINSNSNIKLIFKSGKKKTVKLGSWNTKEESGVSYKHTLVSDLKKGDKFKKGNTISYDEAFFEPDIFDKTRVIFKTGSVMRMALMETSNTYEDSTTISSKAAGKLGTSITKSKSFVLKIDDNVINMVNIGDKVEPNDLLFSIATGDLVDENGKFDKESLAILQNIKNKSPKAKMRGKIQNIKIFYNAELDELSPTLKQLAIESNKKLDKDFTGKVNASYSIKGKPLLPGTVEVKIYIEDNIKANIADKLVMSLQLKCTISDVYNHEMKTEDGQDVDGTFSTKSIANRIVSSTTLNATTTSLLNKLRDNVVDMYFK